MTLGNCSYISLLDCGPFILFCVFINLTVLYLFWGAWIVCNNNLTSVAELVLWFPDRISVCIHPGHQNYLIVYLYRLVIVGVTTGLGADRGGWLV